MEYPAVLIDLNKIKSNATIIRDLCGRNGIDVVGVSKVFTSREPIVEALMQCNINSIGEARIESLKKLCELKCCKILIRVPPKSKAADVVRFSDVSVNSELSTIRLLSQEAEKIGVVHKIILMIDLGDLREGIWPCDVKESVREILKLSNIQLAGVGTNLTCYGGVIPDENNSAQLVELKNQLEKEFNITIPIVSGGNSSSLYMLIQGKSLNGINQLRIGEAIVLGRETSYGMTIRGCYDDCFILEAEIVEIKEKPSIPIGNIGLNAFGEKTAFKDNGIRKRALLAVGRQDVNETGLFPQDANIKILGASSDYLIIDITDSKETYEVGNTIKFTMDYGCLLKTMISEFVEKKYI